MAPANHLQPAAATSPGPEPLPVPGEIHLWRTDLDALAADPAVLSPDERARAARLRTPQLAHRFAAGRAFLRRTLAAYLGRPPEALAFAYGPQGRPGLPQAPFDFNLSHCEADALLAVALDRVGVDVERRRPDPDLLGMARQVMSPGELRTFEALRDPDRPKAFYDLWTAKEAVIKALGTGFSRDARTLHLGWGELLSAAEGGLAFQVARLDYAPGVPAAAALAREIRSLKWRG